MIHPYTPDKIVSAHPHLKLKQVHDALSYYYENRNELDGKIRKDKQFVQELSKKLGAEINSSTVSRKRFMDHLGRSI